MHKVDMNSKKYIVGIDIGSSNVTMAVGLINSDDKISVIGVDVQSLDEGVVKCGEILFHEHVGKAIARSKKALEEELKLIINSAYVGISGKSVYSVIYEDYIDVTSTTGLVGEHDLLELKKRIDMVISDHGDVIVSRIPIRYRINDTQEVKSPLGAVARKLSASYLFAMASRQQVDLVKFAMHTAGIRMEGIRINSTIMPKLLLNSSEMEMGVAIVDIGSDITDIAIVSDNKLRYFSSLPIGASSINNDMRNFIPAQKKDIERLKRCYGSAVASMVPENATVSVKVQVNKKKTVLQRNFAEIAEERLKDIAGFVAREIKAANYSTKIPCGVVLTGGAAYLNNIDDLFARELDMDVRLGTTLNGFDDESEGKVAPLPQAVALGLLLHGAENKPCEVFAIPNGGVAGMNGIQTPPTPPVVPPVTPPVPPITPPVPPVTPPIETPTSEPTQTTEVEQPTDNTAQPGNEEVEEPTTTVEPVDEGTDKGTEEVTEIKTTDDGEKSNGGGDKPTEGKKRSWWEKLKQGLSDVFEQDEII